MKRFRVSCSDLRDSLELTVLGRIHFVYRYPSHDFAARRKIWNNFIGMARKNEKIVVDIDEKGIDELAKLSFNGRQVSYRLTSSLIVTLTNNSRSRMR